MLQLLREDQLAEALGMRVQQNKEKGTTAVMFFRRDNASRENVGKLVEIRRLLKPEGQHQSKLIYSTVVGDDGNFNRLGYYSTPFAANVLAELQLYSPLLGGGG